MSVYQIKWLIWFLEWVELFPLVYLEETIYIQGVEISSPEDDDHSEDDSD